MRAVAVALHLIPDDDGQPHAPTGQCGCRPRIVRVTRLDGTTRLAFQHPAADGTDVDPRSADLTADT